MWIILQRESKIRKLYYDEKKAKKSRRRTPHGGPQEGRWGSQKLNENVKKSTLFHFQQSSQWLVTISYVTFSLTVLNTFWRNTFEKYKCFSKATRMVMVIFTENANVKIIRSFFAPKNVSTNFFCFLRAILKINQIQKSVSK